MASLASLRNDSIDAVMMQIARIDRRAGREQLGTQIETLCLHFHILAVGALLVDGNPAMFFLNLCRAAENWRRLLRHSMDQGWQPFPATKNSSLLGAVAAGHWELADQVATLSAQAWQQGEEYEDDYRYATVLQELAKQDGLRNGNIEALVTALEVTGGAEYASRTAVVKSLLALDESGFFEAFSETLSMQEVMTEKKARSISTPITSFAPHRYIWMEGLALLRLAERSGFSVHNDYLYCPPLARMPMTEVYRGDWVVQLGS